MSFQKKGSCTATTASTATRPLAGKKSPSPTLTPNSKAFNESSKRTLRDVSNLTPSPKVSIPSSKGSPTPSPKVSIPSSKGSPTVSAFQRLYEQGTEKIRAIRAKAVLNSPPLKSESKKTPSPRSAPQTKTPTVRSKVSTPRTPYSTLARPLIEENATQANSSVEARISLETQASSLEASAPFPIQPSSLETNTIDQQVSTPELPSNSPINTLEAQANPTASTTVQTQTNTSEQASTVFQTQASILQVNTVEASTSTSPSELIVLLQTFQGSIARFQSLEKIIQLLIANGNSPQVTGSCISEEKKEKIRLAIEKVEKDIEALNSEIDELKNNNNDNNDKLTSDNDKIESGNLNSDNDSLNNNDNSKDDQTTAVPTIEKEKPILSSPVANEVVELCIGFHKTTSEDSMGESEPSQSVAVPVDPRVIEPVRFQNIAPIPQPSTPEKLASFVEEEIEEEEAEEEDDSNCSQDDSHCPSFFDLLDELEEDRLREEKRREEEEEKCFLMFFTSPPQNKCT